MGDASGNEHQPEAEVSELSYFRRCLGHEQRGTPSTLAIVGSILNSSGNPNWAKAPFIGPLFVRGRGQELCDRGE
jgi:hypothetical protein